MGSSEIVSSGRVSGGRSNFSQTCSLLSQYLKEKGTFGDLSLGFTQSFETKGAPTETMDLLPKIDKSYENSGSRNLNLPPAVFSQLVAGRDESATKSETGTAPMTIFYGGKVIVFNDFPADKAKEIMALASKSSTIPAHNHSNAAFAPPQTADSATSMPKIVPNFAIQNSAPPPLDSDLPIARKNSLARFLEKRKDRVTANAPYPATKRAVAPPKPATAEAAAWLGLVPQLPLQIQRH